MDPRNIIQKIFRNKKIYIYIIKIIQNLFKIDIRNSISNLMSVPNIG